jgi:prenyltransferase beta subunit
MKADNPFMNMNTHDPQLPATAAAISTLAMIDATLNYGRLFLLFLDP